MITRLPRWIRTKRRRLNLCSGVNPRCHIAAPGWNGRIQQRAARLAHGPIFRITLTGRQSVYGAGQVWYKLDGRPVEPACEMQGIARRYS
jgi:hypothetical protein